MNIAILELYRGPAGEKGFYNRQEVGLARAFAALGHRVLVVYPRPARDCPAPREEQPAPGVTVRTIPAGGIGVHGRYRLDFLVREGIDLVHLDADNQLFAPGVARFCRRHGIRFYCYVGAVGSDSAAPLKRLLSDALTAGSRRVLRSAPTFAKTPAVQAWLQRYGIRAAVAPVGLDLAEIPADPPMPPWPAQGKKRLLFVGRLEAYKRPLDAVELLAMLGEDYELAVIGDGSLRPRLEAAAEAHGVAGRLRLQGRLPNAAIHGWARAADCLVNFNEREIFGMSLLEAMYQGCPVVARQAPGPALIVEEGRTGYLCDSVAAMAGRVRQAVAQKAVLGPAARARVLARFTWQATARQFLAAADVPPKE